MQEPDLNKQYEERMKIAFLPGDRIILANELDCPAWLLAAICRDEIEYEVVKTAIINPTCPDEAVEIALERFPNLNNEDIRKLRNKKVWALERMKELKELEEEAKKVTAGDRDQVLLAHILEKDKLTKEHNHATLHLGSDDIGGNTIFRNPNIKWADTNKFRIAFLMPPSWGVLFPPYNLAKLTGVLRKNDYSVKVYDINVEAYHYFLDSHGQDYWKSERYFLWAEKANFEKYLLPDLSLIFDKVIDDLLVSNVKVVGLSMYTTNVHASIHLAKMLRLLLPNVCLVAGGPETVTTPSLFEPHGEAYNLFNYIFVGEAEENLLNTLDNLPEQLPINQIVGSTNSRLDLDKYDYPDYSDYRLTNYLNLGVSIETSRGCVAQCSFCAETYFWKFRSLTPERVVDEMEYQIKQHNVQRFWFTDSLANGNLKNFERLVDLIIERGLVISWNTYARCDGRMTEEFFYKIKKSGCTALSFGVESGSQKVLDDMRKKIKVWEIENNMRDGNKVGMFNHINWMIGFATEEAIDHFHSLQLLYNIRKWGKAISPGFTAGLAKNSHSETDFKIYGIVGKNYTYDTTFLSQWYTEGYKNTVIHRFIRLKFTHIWLEMIDDYFEGELVNSQRYGNIKEFYKFVPLENSILPSDYVDQDFHALFDQGGDTFEGSLVNEYIGFAYLLYKYFGNYDFEFTCDPEVDLKTFGDILARKYTAKLKVNVDGNDNYTFELQHSLVHDNPKETAICDQSFSNSVVLKGNIKDWQSETPIVRETIHESYRRKTKES